MNITTLSSLSKTDFDRIMKRSFGINSSILPTVRAIMEDVRQNGDSALVSMFTKRFRIINPSIQVSDNEIQQAYEEVDSDFIKGLTQMKQNIKKVQKAQLPKKIDTEVTPQEGITVSRRWRAIERVGLYIPGGKAIYPSSVLMTAIPAIVAGCREIIMCTPARGEGCIPAPTLVAADMVGIKKIFKLGGAEAIAAMTYGTDTVPNVYKIFGAGNAYVTAAKMCAQERIAIDMPAGPSEVLIIADDSAIPAFIAADLLADAEHGEDSACVLLTTSEKVARDTIDELEKQLSTLPSSNRARKSLNTYGLIALVNLIDEAIDFTNIYAPEHLEIMTRNPNRVARKITNAGSVFLGNYTAKATGDYATGANHVLPTGGMAKMYPPLGVDSFGKWMQVQKCTKTGLINIRKTIETVADIEQLPAHARSVSIRFKK